MNALDRFLKEDMLIIRPSVFIYIDKNQRENVQDNGIAVQDGKISAYLSRLPESSYSEFLSTHYPVRITLSKIKKIKDQIVQCVAKNIDGIDKFDYKDENLLDKLIKKYSHYLSICYQDHIPIDQLPHIDLYFSKGVVPGFICKVLDA